MYRTSMEMYDRAEFMYQRPSVVCDVGAKPARVYAAEFCVYAKYTQTSAGGSDGNCEMGVLELLAMYHTACVRRRCSQNSRITLRV